VRWQVNCRCLLPRATDRTILIFSSAIGKPTCAGFLTAWVGSNNWIEYNGISNHKKLLDSNANFEEFEVDSPEKHLHIKAQTLRLYNPETHQWSIYLLDLDKGLLPMPPVVGEFNGNRGEFYDQEQYKGRAIFVRYVWSNISPKSARMEQSFSADGGKTWETNWVCELSR
jgi:hypothetical protein